jgi:hypothetical protein
VRLYRSSFDWLRASGDGRAIRAAVLAFLICAEVGGAEKARPIAQAYDNGARLGAGAVSLCLVIQLRLAAG